MLEISIIYKPMRSEDNTFYAYIRNLMMNAMPMVLTSVDETALITYIFEKNSRTENHSECSDTALMVHSYTIYHSILDHKVMLIMDPELWTKPEQLKISKPSKQEVVMGNCIINASNTNNSARPTNRGNYWVPPYYPLFFVNTVSEFMQYPLFDGIYTDLIVQTACFGHLIPWQAGRTFYLNREEKRDLGVPPVFICPRLIINCADDKDRAFVFEYQGLIGLRRSLEIISQVMLRELALLFHSVEIATFSVRSDPINEWVGPTETLPHNSECLALPFVNSCLRWANCAIVKTSWEFIQSDEMPVEPNVSDRSTSHKKTPAHPYLNEYHDFIKKTRAHPSTPHQNFASIWTILVQQLVNDWIKYVTDFAHYKALSPEFQDLKY